MMKKKKKKIEKVDPQTLKNFVPTSEVGWTSKGGEARSGPTGPMKDNPVHYGVEKGVRLSKKQMKKEVKKLEK